MAQIIKHRRGSLESLSAVTSSLQKGELVIASGSSNLSVTNGASIVFAVPENGQVQAVNRVLVGANAPNTFAAGTYNGMMKGVPYYASGSSTLYLLGEGANEIPNLVGNISEYSSSVSASLSALSASIGSGNIGSSVTQLNSFSASVLTRLTEIGVVSGSLIASASAAKTTNDAQGLRLDNLESKSSSVDISVAALNSYTSSNTSTTALNAFTASASERFTEIGVVSGSLIASASAAAVANANQNLFTQSAETRFTEIGVVSGSLISSASAAKSTNDTQDGRLTNIESFSGSANSKFTEIGVVSGSLIASASNAAIAIANLNANSGSYALLSGSNVFNGTQVITGSLYITQDLVVYGSSSLFNVTASALDIGQNTIVLNTATPAVRFGGISVADSGSNEGASGSLFWDSLNNHWLYQHPSASGEGYNSAVLISGPKNSGSLGDEATLTSGKIMVAVGEDHIGDSIITQATDNSKISVAGGIIVTGSVTATSFIGSIEATNGVVSGSSQITISNTTGYSDFSGSISASFAEVIANVGSGVGVSITNLNSFSSSTLGRLSNIELFSSSVETKLIEIGVVSGSLIASASTAKSTNDTQDGRLTNLELTSASLNISVSNLNSTTASLNTSVVALNSSSASQQVSLDNLNSFSGSTLGRLTNLESTSASVNISIEALNSYTSSNTSTNALNAFTASAGGRLGNLETTSASVNVSVSNLNSFSSSVLTQLTEIGVVTASLFSSASSAKSTNDTQDGRLSNLENKSASVDTSISNINSFTASFGTTFSSSVDSRLDTLEGTGTIQGVGTSNNVTFAKVTTTGDVVVGGDLVVQGNTVSLNTATLVVEDKLITLASGSTSSATADGAGFEVAGANANFVYQHSTTSFTSSVALIAPAVTASINLGTTAGSSKRIAFRNTNGNLDLVPTASVAGDLLQWDGNDFVMSNVIDGGSF
jgi:uncharacterized coiled-coil protein SlyX